MSVENYITAFAIYEVAVVVFATLIAMLLLQPSNRIEWATTGKEVAFAMIMMRSLYQIFSGNNVPQPWGVILWCTAAVLLLIYLIVFFEQWLSEKPTPIPMWAIVLVSVSVIALVVMFARQLAISV